jgi:hypothetical protein
MILQDSQMALKNTNCDIRRIDKIGIWCCAKKIIDGFGEYESCDLDG